MNIRTGNLCAAVILIFLCLVLSVNGGELNPPAPPSSGGTMKTLDEVEARIPVNDENTPGDSLGLYKITQPGSYYLTGNITVPESKHGIMITASEVTIDLNGYSVIGPGKENGNSAHGIYTYTGLSQNLTIKNGSVKKFKGHGVFLYNTGHSVINVDSTENGDYGFYLLQNCRIIDCSAGGNTNGLIIYSGIVKRCNIYNNNVYGLIGTDAVVTECYIHNNGVISMQTSVTLTRCILKDCNIYQNAGDPASIGVVATESRVEDNNIQYSGSTGLQLGKNSYVKGNNIRNNGSLGIRINGDNCYLIQNVLSDNSGTVYISPSVTNYYMPFSGDNANYLF